MTIFRFSLLVAAALVVSGCTEKISDEELICDPSPGFIESSAATTTDAENVVQKCIHKWGYRLGRAPGSNDEIARATVEKCWSATGTLRVLKVREGIASKQPFTDANWQVIIDQLNERAFQRVVQGRAGKCSIRGEDQK